MEDHERVNLLESYQRPYPSYAGGICAVGDNPCAERNPENCRNCRQQNETKK